MLINLKTIMDQKNIKTKDIAKLLDLKSPAVSKRIHGQVKVPLDEKEKIANFLGFEDYEYLFEDKDPAPVKNEMHTTKFSQRFTELLLRDGRSQKEIASLLGVNERTISDWKLAKQSTNLEMLNKISATLNTTVSYLSGESNEYYPNSVDYLDNSMKEYQAQVDNIKHAVSSYLGYIGFDIKKLELIASEKPLINSSTFSEKFQKEHYQEYLLSDKIKEEINKHTKKIKSDYGLDPDFDYESKDSLTLKEQKVMKLLDKDEYINSKYEELEKIEDIIDSEYLEAYSKEDKQAEQINGFFLKLPGKILEILEQDLSDIISEFDIFDFEYKNFNDNSIKLSYLEKKLYECNELYREILALSSDEYLAIIKNDCAFSNSPSIMNKLKFDRQLVDFKGAYEDKQLVLAFLDNKIKKTKGSINSFNDYFSSNKQIKRKGSL